MGEIVHPANLPKAETCFVGANSLHLPSFRLQAVWPCAAFHCSPAATHARLANPAKSQVDPKLAGYWMSQSDDEREVIAMLPFDEHTYVVEDVKLKKR